DLLGPLPGHRQPDSLTGAQVETGAQVVQVEALEIGVAGDDERVVAADDAVEAVAMVAQPGPHLGVVEPDAEVEVELEGSLHSLHDAQQLASWVAATAPAHREAVVQASLPGARLESRDQHQRVVEVLAVRLVRLGGHDLAVPAAVPVEQSGEDAAGVEARHAAPVDRRLRRHERSRVAVADERVVGDRGLVVWVGAHEAGSKVNDEFRGARTSYPAT